MRAWPGLAALAILLGAGMALASPPEHSPRPAPRPGAVAPEPATEAAVRLVAAGTAVARSPRPAPRPENLKRRAIVRAAGVRVQPDPGITFGKKGAVCGVASIKGAKLAPIAGRVKGCGVPDPVQVTSVQGVLLSTPAIMDCTTAKALDKWVRTAVLPEVGRLGGGVASLQVAAHYACRPRNNVRGARISEHGKGHAIDISAINLKNGISLTVLKGWNDAVQGRILRAVHRAACGTFGTVLGPGSDGYHRDHIHLDTARYRSGSYCR